MTAVDKHSPHHIRRRDSLNILHQRQLDFLMSAKAKNEQTVETLMCLEAKKNRIFNQIYSRSVTYMTLRRSSMSIKGELRVKTKHLEVTSIFLSVSV